MDAARIDAGTDEMKRYAGRGGEAGAELYGRPVVLVAAERHHHGLLGHFVVQRD